MKETNRLETLFNLAGLSAVIIILLIAFSFQILFHELPCPLCLLQRLGFFGIALGFILNLRFGMRSAHYATILLSALFTSLVALRQVALHVVPGTGAYGSAFLGMHLYSWAFIISIAIIVVTSFMLGMAREYNCEPEPFMTHFKLLTSLLFIVLLIMLGLNIITVLLECGITECPANPTQYFFPWKSH